MTAKPVSKKAQARQAEKLLLGLLKAPRTRAGLIAAVASAGVSRNFVYGWIVEKTRTGVVAALKSSNPPMYQLSGIVIAEKPAFGSFPSWLEPRTLPTSATGCVYIDGQAPHSERRRAAKQEQEI